MALWACSKRQTLTPDSADIADQQAYFPVFIGKTNTFRVDSIQFDLQSNGAVSDTVSFHLKETVVDTFRDGGGQLWYKVEQYTRFGPDDPWVVSKVFAEAVNNSQSLRLEDNLKFLRCVFPFDRRSNWNGNIYLDEAQEIVIRGERLVPYQGWNYEVDSLNLPEMINGIPFDSVLTITESDQTNIIERRLSRAKYAKHAGLVWREQWILDSQYCNADPPPADCESRPWELKAEKGYILRMVVE